MQPQVPARSVEILRDIQKGSKSRSHVPLMLHTSGSKAGKKSSAPTSNRTSPGLSGAERYLVAYLS
jgi:hypothetical protein